MELYARGNIPSMTKVRVHVWVIGRVQGVDYARVDHVEVREEPFRGEFHGFEIRY